MKPTEEYIRQLLERYYQGDTNRDEERLLKEYFGQDDVPASLKAEQEMFRYLAHNARQTPPLPEGLEERLARNIDRRAAEEQRHRQPRTLRHPHLWRWAAGIAASLLLASAIGIRLYTQHHALAKDTFDEPQLAYVEARRALHLFNAAFEKGERQMEEARKATQEIQQKLKKYQTILNPQNNP